MSIFIVLCVLLTVAVLAFLLRPLLMRRQVGTTSHRPAARNAAVYQDQMSELDAELKRGTIGEAEWAASRAAIERRALDEAESASPSADVIDTPETHPSRAATTAAVVGVVLPIAAVALYLLLGTPQALSPDAIATGQQSVSQEQIEAMVSKLADRLKTTPEDTEGWIMLGRSYAAMGRFPESASAYAKAAAQRPTDAQLLADYADALGMANGRNLKGEPEALIARALKADGSNIKALTLAGTIAYQKADYRKAIALWQAILPQVPADAQFAESVRGIISDAQAQLEASKGKAPQAKGRADTQTAATTPALLQGTVSLSASLKSKAGPDDTVFVYARAASGPRMPLAIMRSTVKELPLKFSLDDSSAMSPTMKLSAFEQVVLVARISKSGSPAPQKGDLEGVSAPMAPRANGIRLEIANTVE